MSEISDLVERMDKLCELLASNHRILLDAGAAAELYGISKSTFLQRVACRPDFPVPCALTTADDPSPRWLRDELVEYAKRHRMPRARERRVA